VLTLSLRYRTSHAGDIHGLRGLVAPTGSGSVSDYWVTLLDANCRRPKAHALLEGYPRWAEPTRALVARALEAALSSVESTAWPACGACELTVREWGTQDVVDQVAFGNVRESVVAHQSPLASGRNAWQLIQWVCAWDAFNGHQLPPFPKVLRPKVYQRSGVSYCRTGELPLEARVAFERLQSVLDRPFVPAVPDAVYPWWMDAFLRGELSARRPRETL